MPEHELGREILPIPDAAYVGLTTYDAKDPGRHCYRSQPPLGGMGGITEIATWAPGYSSVRPRNKAPLAETLKLPGYSTAHATDADHLISPEERYRIAMTRQ